MDIIELIRLISSMLQNELGIKLPTRIIIWILLIIGIITLVVYIIKIIVNCCEFVGELRQSPWRRKQIDLILMPDYSAQIQEQKYFISTKFTTTPPNNLDDPLEVERTESAKKLVDYFLDSVLVKSNSTNRFYCILAGAGMGKTTWTVNLVTSYINHYKKSTLPFDIKLISLARRNFAEE